jgi:response regulator of citrate/malate metabolism
MNSNENTRILVIDNNELCVDFLCEKFGCDNGYEQKRFIAETSSYREIAERIKNEYENSNCVIFIHVNLAKEGEKRLDHHGIELLTWLRIKKVMHHCVLYSFQSAETILRADNKNRLLFSKGCTFIRLPDDFSQIIPADLIRDRATENDIKTNIKSIINVEKFRHRYANWWGVKQLWDVHKIAEGGNFEKDYPPFIKRKLEDLDNAAGVFLNDLDDDVSSALENFSNEANRIKDELTAQIRQIEGAVEEKEFYSTVVQMKIDENCKKLLALQGDSELKLKSFSELQQLRNKLEESEKLRRNNADFDAERKEIITKIEALGEEIGSLNKQKSAVEKYQIAKQELFDGVSIPAVRNGIKILLIDDNADKGWSQIFEYITKATIKPVIPASEYQNRIKELYKKVKKKISDFKPDLIMLDLRLFDETNPSVDLNDLSGKLLLEEIKSDFFGTPIMITSASNKIWTYQKLINLEADAYWIKEGFDESREAKDSIDNYLNLLSLINKLTDEKYKTLSSLFKLAKDFRATSRSNKSKHWFVQGNWSNRERRAGNVNNISSTLKDAVISLKGYLHNYHINQERMEKPNSVYVLSGLINKIAGIVEDVHGIEKNSNNNPAQRRSASSTFNERSDERAKKLYKLRGNQSHVFADATWEHLDACISLAELYLLNSPEAMPMFSPETVKAIRHLL